MRVIAKSALVKYWNRPECAGSASLGGNHRVVLNISGNQYRLVVEMQYQAGIAWVKFVGTHAQYERINVETVNEY